MKILFLIPYPTGSAPSQRFRFEQYLEFLRTEGHKVEISPFLDQNTWNVLYSQGNIAIKGLGIFKGFIKRFTGLIKAGKADLIFIHREATPVGPPVFEWFIAKVLGKRIVYDFDDAIWLPNTSKENRLVAGMKWHGKVRSICRWSWKISAGNQFLANFASRYNHNTVINPTTIDTENLHKPGADPSDKVTVGWTGTHSTARYMKAILPVLAKLASSHSFKLLYISNQPSVFELQNLEYRPWTKESEIRDLQEIDIGLMPLADDDWAKGKCGFKALQYMALEIPALVSPVGVNATIVEHGVEGFHCKTETDWIKFLEILINDPNKRRLMGQAGRKKVRQSYSVAANQQNFLNLFLR